MTISCDRVEYYNYAKMSNAFINSETAIRTPLKGALALEKFEDVARILATEKSQIQAFKKINDQFFDTFEASPKAYLIVVA